VASLTDTYRIRQGGATYTSSLPQGEYQGAFALCTVMGGEFLDENFQRVDQLRVDRPVQAYVRFVDSRDPANGITATITTKDSKANPVSSDVSVTLSRLGASSTFLGPVTFLPRGWTGESGLSAHALAAPQGPQARCEYVLDVAYCEKTGKTVATNRLVCPAQLAIEFLDEAGNRTDPQRQVTRIVKVADPGLYGHSLYPEETLVRVVALAADHTLAQSVDAVVRIDELPNGDFPSWSVLTTTRDWRFTYQHDLEMSTNLRSDRINPGDFTAIPLVGGKTDSLPLHSLAGPRRRTGDLGFAVGWDARLVACQALNAVDCTEAPDDKLLRGDTTVTQWVDQQSYSRHEAGAEFERSLGSNSLVDWLEAAVWDAISDAPLSGGPIATTVSQEVQSIGQQPGTSPSHEWAHVSSDQPTLVMFYPMEFCFDALRWDQRLGVLKHGFLIDSPTSLAAVALHESRHCWQFAIRQGDDVDVDFVPGHPEDSDPLAIRLKDDHYQFPDLGTGNPEAHFAGDVESDANFETRKTQTERDAYCFETRAFAGSLAEATASNQLAAATLTLATTPLSVRVGQTLPDALRITVTGRLGIEEPVENDEWGNWSGGIGDVVVEAALPPGGGMRLTPQNTAAGACFGDTCVAETDPAGVAHFDIEGITAGTYPIVLSVRKLVPEGDRLGDVLSRESITVEVKP
jgi:hypothetical protein